MSNLGQVANIVKSLILQQAWIFGEEVAEEEAVQEVAEESKGANTEPEVLAEQPDLEKDLPIGLGLDTDIPNTLTKPIESFDSPISPVGAVVNFGGEESETLISETPLKEVDQTALVPTPLPDYIASPDVTTTFATSPNGINNSTIRASSTPRERSSPSQWFENDGAHGLSLEFSVKTTPPPPLIPPPKVGEAFIDSLSLPSPISESLFADSKPTTPTP